jgi:hypothetical protein
MASPAPLHRPSVDLCPLNPPSRWQRYKLPLEGQLGLAACKHVQQQEAHPRPCRTDEAALNSIRLINRSTQGTAQKRKLKSLSLHIR